MDSNTTLNPGNRLLITWVDMTYQIKDRYLPSIHFWDSGPWYVLYIPLLLSFCYFLVFFFFFLIVCRLIFAFFVFMSLDSSLSNKESIVTCLLSFWLIIKLYHFYHGWIKSCYSILLKCIIVDIILSYCH